MINQIEARIDEFLQNSGIITLTAPTPLLITNGTDANLAVQGCDDHGLFKDDPETLKLFDEIEDERDAIWNDFPESIEAASEGDKIDLLTDQHTAR